MKYHYQFVSRTTVRIELIPEDKRETALIDSFFAPGENDEQLMALFRKGIEDYASNARLTETRFMNFPKVALCSYNVVVQTAELIK